MLALPLPPLIWWAATLTAFHVDESRSHFRNPRSLLTLAVEKRPGKAVLLPLTVSPTLSILS